MRRPRQIGAPFDTLVVGNYLVTGQLKRVYVERYAYSRSKSSRASPD